MIKSPMRVVFRVFAKEQFNPGPLGVLVNPFYFPRKLLLDEIRALAPRVTGRLLDIGCGTKPYRDLFPVSEYIGLEVDTESARQSKHADYFYDGKNLPFGDREFDAIFMSQVFEHVFEPDALLDEIYRVLKPGGKLFLTVPFAWDEHEQPWDFARYTSFGLRHIVEKRGFTVLESRKTAGDIRVVTQMVNNYLYKTFIAGRFWRHYYMVPFLIGPFNVLGVLLSRILPKNPDFYLDNIILLEKKTERLT